MQNDTIDFSKYNTKWIFVNFNECVFQNNNDKYSIKLLNKIYYLYHNDIFLKSSIDANELFLYIDEKLSEKIVCIYHKNCPDGFASAWVLNNYFKKQNKTVEFIPLSYGMELPIIENSKIYLLDFSFDSIEIYEQYLEKNINITIIDHHKKTIDMLSEYDNIKLTKCLDIEYSGCILTWRWFNGYNIINRPKILEYIQDRDLYTWKLQLSKESLCVIDLWEYDFDVWDKNSEWFEKNTNSVVKKGSDILEYKQKLINKLYKKRHYCDFIDYKNILCVNSNLPEIDSEVAELMYNDDPERFVIIYHFSDNNIRLSFRSKSGTGIDVNEIAKQFDGGGHKHASGCTLCNSNGSNEVFLNSFSSLN